MDKENIKITSNNKNKISFLLKNKNLNENDLKMHVYMMKMGIFRIKIDDYLNNKTDSEEIKKRFKVTFFFP